METKVRQILEKTLPESAFIHVSTRKNFFGGDYLRIAFAASETSTGCATGNRPQQVSLNLDLTDLELQTQVYGGTGGQSIYRKPNLNDDKEKYLAMKSVRVPFRRPKKAEKNILQAIEKFALNWLKTLKENKETLLYKDIVNYDTFLS